MAEDTLTWNEKEDLFWELSTDLVEFWIRHGRPDKRVKVELLERMLEWYRKMGYATMD